MNKMYPIDLKTLPEWYELPPINSSTSISPQLVDDLLDELNCIGSSNNSETIADQKAECSAQSSLNGQDITIVETRRIP